MGSPFVATTNSRAAILIKMDEPQSRPAALPTSDLDALRSTKTVLLTTYKRDGTAVGTPVSIAVEGPRAFFRSWHKAWKTKRIARNPDVLVQPSDLRGRPKGPAVEASARLLEGNDAKLAARSLARRHRLLQGLMVPTTHRLMRYRTMHYELISREPKSVDGGRAAS
jgi:PPOX class probable F420-dependent enzyme